MSIAIAAREVLHPFERLDRRSLKTKMSKKQGSTCENKVYIHGPALSLYVLRRTLMRQIGPRTRQGLESTNDLAFDYTCLTSPGRTGGDGSGGSVVRDVDG